MVRSYAETRRAGPPLRRHVELSSNPHGDGRGAPPFLQKFPDPPPHSIEAVVDALREIDHNRLAIKDLRDDIVSIRAVVRPRYHGSSHFPFNVVPRLYNERRSLAIRHSPLVLHGV